MKKLISFLAAAALLFILAFSEIAGIDIGQFSPSSDTTSQTVSQVQGSSYKTDAAVIDEDGSYFDKENVALYIHTYGKLPDNFITKDEARDLGWEGGSVEKYAPGKAIGGDRFGNYEGLLPKKKGRTYTECDIDTDGYHSRGSRRIVFSNDGLIYYTHDHYESFELLYGELTI
ncbi:MAG: ribonuclease [Ruminococcaceae bacterium]|nr:ribonuclease [Oscillospiraceae bacterium]